MELTPVSSSNIAGVHHDPETSKLTVDFTNGSRYEFDEVSAEKHQALMSAESVGRHFQTYIRYHHNYRRIG